MKYLKKYKIFESTESEFLDMFSGNIISDYKMITIPETHVTRYGGYQSKTGANIYVIYGNKLEDDETTLQELYYYEKHLKSLNKEYYYIYLKDNKIVIIIRDLILDSYGNPYYQSPINYRHNIENCNELPIKIKNIIKNSLFDSRISSGINYSNGGSSNLIFPKWKHEPKTENTFEKYSKSFEKERNIKDIILNLKKISKDKKEEAIGLLKSYTKAGKGKITGLNLNSELKKKIKDGEYPSGFDMGIDQNGYFIHTHRARSKSYEKSTDITVKEIKFIDSTG